VSLVMLFLCGDVMTGRGIDQVLPHPGDPTLHEPYLKNALAYVTLASRVSGPIPYPVDFSYIWGDAIDELERVGPDLRIINLETSVTRSKEHWTGKDVLYRMNPENIICLTVAKIDCCSLANNHTLDWGYAGLMETLETLQKANLKTAGAGQDIKEAETPAVLEVNGKGRVIVFSFGSPTSGIPVEWAASGEKPGINLLRDLSAETAQGIGQKVRRWKRQGDIAVASIHWGANWGYEVPRTQIEFAHELIDCASIDVVHGHSSHHVKAIEIYRGRPIFYGCGDFLNDYEGITGHEAFRADLGLMYFISIDLSTGMLADMFMTPTQIKSFRVNRAPEADAVWLRDTLGRESAKFGSRVELRDDNRLALERQ